MNKKLLSIFTILLSAAIQLHSEEQVWLKMDYIPNKEGNQDEIKITNLGANPIDVNNWTDVKVLFINDDGNSIFPISKMSSADWASPIPTKIQIKPGSTINIKISGYWYRDEIMGSKEVFKRIKKDKFLLQGFLIKDISQQYSNLNDAFIIYHNPQVK